MSKTLMLALSALVLLPVLQATADDVVITPEQTNEVLANPDMGWETFHVSAKQDKSLPDWIPSTVFYIRWGWNSLEPQPGKLNTELLDKTLKAAHNSGQNSHSA